MVQIGDDYYEDLSPERLNALLDDLKAGKEIAAGSQIGRLSSMPEGAATTLTELPARAPVDTGRAVQGPVPPGPESPGGEGA
jgi:NADH-quinone oxidoreductase subunit E